MQVQQDFLPIDDNDAKIKKTSLKIVLIWAKMLEIRKFIRKFEIF